MSVNSRSRPSSQSNSALHSAKLRLPSVTGVSFSYEILESPMGVDNYVATLKLTPITDGARCFGEWSAEFDCDEGRELVLTEQIGAGVFQGGFDALKRHFSRR